MFKKSTIVKNYELRTLLNGRSPIWVSQTKEKLTFLQAFFKANIKNAVTWMTLLLSGLLVKFKNLAPNSEIILVLIFVLLGSLNAYSNTKAQIIDNQAISGYTVNAVFKINNPEKGIIRIVPFEDIDDLKVNKLKNGNHSLTFYNFVKKYKYSRKHKVICLEFRDVNIPPEQLDYIQQKIFPTSS